MDKELELQYRVHAALDVVEEKCTVSQTSSQDSRDLYIGLLYSTEYHKMYVQTTIIHFECKVESKQYSLFIVCILFASIFHAHRYGYVTNSKIKFIIVVDSSNTALRENDVRTVSTIVFVGVSRIINSQSKLYYSSSFHAIVLFADVS